MSWKRKQTSGEDEQSLRGTLTATIVFVGGGILLFIVLLFVLYMIRI